MSSSKIVAMYRVKNESRWIEESLKSASKICNEIVVLDDGSTDDTVKICESFDSVVEIHKQTNLPFDETRDKNILLKMALKRNPDFILTLDGDETIMTNSKRTLLEELNVLYPDSHVFEFQVLYIWDKPNQYRYDGIYSNIWPKRLVRISKQPHDLHFEEMPYPGNAHCPAMPQNSFGWNKPIRSKIKILHYGYYDELLRQSKYKFYTSIDSKNETFDGYKHIISGKGKCSGPMGMEFRTIPEGIYVSDIK